MIVKLAKEEIDNNSIVDGAGLRAVIWAQGCSHNCKGCHNPETHNFDGGYSLDVEVVKEKMKKLTFNDGITFSGGDPMFQPEAFAELAKFAKQLNLNVWCYTGFTFEELLKRSKQIPKILEFLQNIDVLVDGKFILEQRSLNLYYKGSKNQRVLNVKQSLEKNCAVEIEKYKKEKNENIYQFGKNGSSDIFI